MRKLLALLLPFALWAQIIFVLFDAGETVSLMPVINELMDRGEEVVTLKFDPRVIDRYAKLPEEEVSKYRGEVFVVGDASTLQLQFVEANRGRARIYCYYDNPLEIDRIPYAPLIREFEKKADYFLVPSKCAAMSSKAENPMIVGNADLDLFEETLSQYEVTPGRVTYIGGYDADYEQAFCHFSEKYKDYEGQVVVRPHPKSDGALEKKYTEGTTIQVGEALSSMEAVGRSELIVIHRSSLGTKASICGKRVIAIESDGTVADITHTRESLGVPRGAAALFSDLVQQKSLR